MTARDRDYLIPLLAGVFLTICAQTNFVVEWMTREGVAICGVILIAAGAIIAGDHR